MVFFVSNMDRVFSTEMLIERVWPEKEYHNNSAAVRTQVFRLKKQLTDRVPELSYQLEFSHGGYLFSLDRESVTVDTEEFQQVSDLILAAESEMDADGANETEKLFGLCREAFEIYQSGFLVEEMFDGDWLVPLRQNYRRKWLRIVEIYVQLCRNSGLYGDIISLCQQILNFEDVEEFIHETYMEALWKAGYSDDATRHYEQISMLSRNNESLKNSIRLRELSRSISREQGSNQMIDSALLAHYIKCIGDRSTARICDRDIFMNYCYLQMVAAERTETYNYVCVLEIIDLESDEGNWTSADDLYKPFLGPVSNYERGMFQRILNIDYLIGIIKKIIRKYDAICEWNEKQVLLLLSCKQELNEGNILKRIKSMITKDNPGEKIRHLPLSLKMIPLSGLDTDLLLGERK